MKSLLILPRKGILNMIIYEKFLAIFCVKKKYESRQDFGTCQTVPFQKKSKWSLNCPLSRPVTYACFDRK